MSKSLPLQYLPYAGLLPFIGCAGLLLFGIRDVAPFGSVTFILLAYALTIVCFMAGVHWGQILAGAQVRLNLLVSSNVVALVAWGSYIALSPDAVFLIFTALFALLYMIDTQLGLDPTYMKTRRNVTCVVCGCLIVVALA